MNTRTELPQLAALQQSTSIEAYENLAFYDDNCYNSDFLEHEYGEVVRSLISGCIERGQLNRRQFQNSFRQLIDNSDLAPDECIEVAFGVLRERFSNAAVDAHSLESAVAPPDVAPELYENRKRPESPIEYYDRVWRKYADAGALYQDQLRKLDPKLIPAIHTHCSRHQLDPKDHLPPPRHERTKRLAASGDVSAIANLHNAERLRAWRSKHGASPV